MKNEKLYTALKQIFGDVQVHNKGLPLKYYCIGDKIKITHFGEQYSINCPFCGDVKSHLWISYAWGTVINNKYIYPAKCYRRECLQNYKLLQKLKKMIATGHKYVPDYYKIADIERKDEKEEDDREILAVYNEAIALEELDWGHPAISYLVERNFDPYKLGKKYGARVCEDLLRNSAFARIVFPIYDIQNQLIGWVGRTYLGKQPKYLNSRTKVNSSFFNLPNALAYDSEIVVVTEGIFDCVRTEELLNIPTVASLGKSLSYYQQELLKRWKYRIIFYDADAYEDAQKEARKIDGIAIRCPDVIGDPGNARTRDDLSILSQVINYFSRSKSLSIRQTV
ncbi:MAG: hypothetical protein QXQ37_05760 [Nitrososphaerota archaeon]